MTKPTTVGYTIFLWINCDNDEEATTIFLKLSRSGKIATELQTAYWGTLLEQLLISMG